MSGITQAVGGLLGGSATTAGQQANTGYNNALAQTTATYNSNSPNYAPFIQNGTQANNQLTAGLAPNGALGRQFTMADYQQSPAYNFDLQQGMAAINNSASVRGGALSGGTQKALMNYGQNQANNSYQQALQNYTSNQQQNIGALSNLSGQGLQATQGLGQLGSQYGQNQGNLLVGQGNSNASATMAASNMLGGVISGGAGALIGSGALAGLGSAAATAAPVAEAGLMMV